MLNYDEMKENLIKGYIDLLEVQYHNKPKAKATIKLLIETLLADMLMFKLREITYGSDYKVELTCRECGTKQKVNIDGKTVVMTARVAKKIRKGLN